MVTMDCSRLLDTAYGRQKKPATARSAGAVKRSPEEGGLTSVGSAILGAELLEQQLRGCPMFFRGIACLAARHHIPFGTPPAPGEWYNMVHSQCTGRKRALTVCTEALGNFIAPPLRGTQRFRFGFFAGDMAWIFVNVNPICQVRSFVLRP